MRAITAILFLITQLSYADWYDMKRYQKKEPTEVHQVYVGGQWMQVESRQDQRLGRYQKVYAKESTNEYPYPLLPYFASYLGEKHPKLKKVPQVKIKDLKKSPLAKYDVVKGFTPPSGSNDISQLKKIIAGFENLSQKTKTPENPVREKSVHSAQRTTVEKPWISETVSNLWQWMPVLAH